LAHGKKTLSIMSEEELLAIARDFHNAGLSEAEVAMMDYAAKLCADAASMTDEDTRRLRDLGFSDREIVDITMAAAARNFISRSVLAMAVDLDVPRGLSEELKGALLTPMFPLKGPGLGTIG
jgi:alkylhydroperoxidase family enzyme